MTMPTTATGSRLGGRTGTPQVSWGKAKGGYQTGQMQQFTPEQMQLFQSMFGHLGSNSFLGRLASGDQSMFNEMEQPAWRDFQGAQAQLGSRFSGLGTGSLKSSGFRNTATAGASQFAQDLQSQRLGLQNQAIRDLQGMSNQLLQQRPYENFMMEKKPGFFESLLGSLFGAGGQALGGWATGKAFKSKGQGITNMVQFIERKQPTLGERLGGGLERGVSQGLEFSQEMEKKRGNLGFYEQMFGGKSQAGSAPNEFAAAEHYEKMNPAQQAYIAGEHPEVMKLINSQIEKRESMEGLKQTADWLKKYTSFSGKLGLPEQWGGLEEKQMHPSGGYVDPETGEFLTQPKMQAIREGIKTSGIWFADKIYTHFNKGVINKEKWDTIKNQFATDPDLPPVVNRARIAAGERIMALKPNSSPAVVQAAIDKEKKALKKIEQSKAVQESLKKNVPGEELDLNQFFRG